jgi:osmotically-inducible protein OsmY
MIKNEDLQRDVQDAIKWEPLLSAAEIGVIVKDGVVTLSGIVDSFAKKTETEDAARKVKGVKAVVEKIEVKFENIGRKNDNEIATDVLSAFKWSWRIPGDRIKAKVEDGWVTLDGEVTWNYQREAAYTSAFEIRGVKGVTNKIGIKSETHDDLEESSIKRALARSWSIGDQDIQVKVIGNQVELKGTVHSLYQKYEAGRIAWKAPGVFVVDNELQVDFNE